MTDTPPEESNSLTQENDLDQNKSSNDIIQIENSEETSLIIEQIDSKEEITMHKTTASKISFLSENNSQDMNYLHGQIKKLQKLLLNEQDKFTKLQKRLQDSEGQRFLSMSETNKEIFNLNSHVTKIRSELEKSEALRQALEYELTMTKSSVQKERNICYEKEKMLEDINNSLEAKLSALNKENIDLKSKFQLLDNEYSNELAKFRASLDEKERFLEKFQTEQDLFEKERETLNDLIKEQEKLNGQYKEEILSHKDVIKKLCLQLENSKEKDEKLKKDLDAFKQKSKILESQLDKERAQHSELKFNMDIVQAKLKDTIEQLNTQEKLKKELEINVTKLIEQLKENRKELNEEQSKNRELKERFKICENQFKTLNNDLTQKLEEKVSTIKKLSTQLSAHENNFKEIKDELKQTQERQQEIDNTYEQTIRDLDYLIKCFTIKSDELNKTNKKQIPVVIPNIAYKMEVLKVTLDEYKEYVMKKFNGLYGDVNKIETLSKENEALKETIDSKEKSIQSFQELKNKQENDIVILRKEREALDEVINSLRAECETLKTSLNREYETNDHTKKQINKITKTNKQINDKRDQFYQSIYKRIMPLFGTIGKDDNLNEQNLEDVIDDTINKLVYYVENFGEKLNKIENNLKLKDEQIILTTRRYEEQIQKLSKSLKEKESSFKKQKDSLVNYYEQLINDVNARVKLNESSTNEALIKLRETEQNKKSLENESFQMKDSLSKMQSDLRNLQTACLLLYGLFVPLINQNRELKEQREIFEALNSRWIHFHNQIIFIQDNIIDKIMLNDPYYDDTNTPDNEKIISTNKSNSKNYHPNKAVKEMLENISQLDISNPKIVRNKRFKSSKLWLFRKSVLIVLACNRLICLKRSNLNTHLVINGIKFLLKNKSINDEYLSDVLKNTFLNQTIKNTPNMEPKLISQWFTSNTQLVPLIQLSHELNKCLYDEDQENNILDMDENLTFKVKQSICEIINLQNNFQNVSRQYNSSKSLSDVLKTGLKSLILKNEKIGKCLSLEMTIQSLNDTLFELKRRFIRLQMDKQLLKPMNEASSKSLNNNFDSKTISLEKFESVCKELESALNREKQAEIILSEQSSQLQELSQKLAEYTTDELQSFKLKENLSSLKTELQHKELAIKTLSQKLNTMNTDDLKLIDRDIFTAYGQNIENHLEKVIKPLLLNNCFKDALYQIKQINEFNLQILSEDRENKNVEILDLYQNIVALFCDNSELILRKLSSNEEEISSLKNQLDKFKEELKIVLKSDLSSSKYSPLLGSELETSFHHLPKFSIHSEGKSAFKPLPVRIIKSSTPTLQNTSFN